MAPSWWMTNLMANEPQFFPANLHKVWPRPAGARVNTALIQSGGIEFAISRSDGSLPVFIVSVTAGSQTEKNGLREGDRVLRVNDQLVFNANDFFILQASSASNFFQLLVERIDEDEFENVELDSEVEPDHALVEDQHYTTYMPNGQCSSAAPQTALNDYMAQARAQQLNQKQPSNATAAHLFSTVYHQPAPHHFYDSVVNQTQPLPSTELHSSSVNEQRLLMLEKKMSHVLVDMEVYHANNAENVNAIFGELDDIRTGHSGGQNVFDEEKCDEEDFRKLTTEECKVMDKLMGTLKLVQNKRNAKSKLSLPSEISFSLKSDGYYREFRAFASNKKHSGTTEGWRPDGVWRDGQRAVIVNGGLEIEVQRRDWNSADGKNVPVRRFEFAKENGRDLVILKENSQVVATYEKPKNSEVLLCRRNYTILFLMIALLLLSAFCFYLYVNLDYAMYRLTMRRNW